MRPRRLDTYAKADCNGGIDERGCTWRRDYQANLWQTKEDAQRHSRDHQHETVVTELGSVVYDQRRIPVR